MRRDAITLAQIASRDNLARAVWKAARGKRHRREVARFIADLDHHLDRLAEDILTERAPDGRHHRFTIHDPKRRVITAICFSDRVLHHAILNLALLDRIIESGAGVTPGLGLPIGALTSQHFANAFLDAGDRMLLARGDVRAALRYMDDIVWWCDTRADALASLDAFRAFLWGQRRLRLKPNARVDLSAAGITFCGFRVRPGVVLASRRKLSRYRAGLRRIETGLAEGSVTEAEAQRAHDGILAALDGTQSLGFRRRLTDRFGDKQAVDPYDQRLGCRLH